MSKLSWMMILSIIVIGSAIAMTFGACDMGYSDKPGVKLSFEDRVADCRSMGGQTVLESVYTSWRVDKCILPTK